MKVRLNDLKNFLEISSSPTIVQAAKKLEISQPALSESLKRLESDLKSILFYRSKSGIQLTPSGKLFLARAQKAMQALNDLDLTEKSENVFAGRTIVIGCHATVAQYSIPKAVSYLKLKANDFSIKLKHDLSRNIQKDIQNGLIDIGIIINPTEVPDLVIQLLGTDQVGVWKNNLKAKYDTIICNLDLFQTQSILKKWPNKPSKIISTDSLELISRMVAEGIGYGILPERAVKLSRFDLKFDERLPTYQDKIYLVHRPEFGKSFPEKLVSEALKKAISSH